MDVCCKASCVLGCGMRQEESVRRGSTEMEEREKETNNCNGNRNYINRPAVLRCCPLAV